MIQPRITSSVLDHLFVHVLSVNKVFSDQYSVLMKFRILTKDNEGFDGGEKCGLKHGKFWVRAWLVRIVSYEFKYFVSRYLDGFYDGGIILEWMTSIN